MPFGALLCRRYPLRTIPPAVPDLASEVGVIERDDEHVQVVGALGDGRRWPGRIEISFEILPGIARVPLPSLPTAVVDELVTCPGKEIKAIRRPRHRTDVVELARKQGFDRPLIAAEPEVMCGRLAGLV